MKSTFFFIWLLLYNSKFNYCRVLRASYSYVYCQVMSLRVLGDSGCFLVCLLHHGRSCGRSAICTTSYSLISYCLRSCGELVPDARITSRISEVYDDFLITSLRHFFVSLVRCTSTRALYSCDLLAH